MSAERERLLEKLDNQKGELARMHLSNTRKDKEIAKLRGLVECLEGERSQLKQQAESAIELIRCREEREAQAGVRLFDSGIT